MPIPSPTAKGAPYVVNPDRTALTPPVVRHDRIAESLMPNVPSISRLLVGTAPDEPASPRLYSAVISMVDDVDCDEWALVPTDPEASPEAASTPRTRKLVVDSPTPDATMTGLMSTN